MRCAVTTQFILIVVLVTSSISTTLILFEVWNLRAGINDTSRPISLVTVTQTATATHTVQVTHTITETATETVTRTATATATVTETVTATATATVTQTATQTVTVTSTPLSPKEITNPWVKLMDQTLDKETDEWVTQNYCFRLPDTSGFCIYKNLCFDGTYFLFMQANATDIKTVERMPKLAHEQYPGWDARYRFPVKFPTPDTIYIPYGHNDLHTIMKILPPSFVDKNQVTWLNGSLYFSKPQHANINPFFFAKDTILVWELSLINQTIGGLLPPLDHLFMPRDEIPTGWATDFLKSVILQPHTQLWINSHIAEYFGPDNFKQTNFTAPPKPPILCSKRYSFLVPFSLSLPLFPFPPLLLSTFPSPSFFPFPLLLPPLSFPSLPPLSFFQNSNQHLFPS